MVIKTELDVSHLELIKVFIEANELTGIVVKEDTMELRGRCHMVLHLDAVHEPALHALTFMGFRHAGVLNMLDDYLIRCGVLPNLLKPPSIGNQLREEKEHEQNEAYMNRLKGFVERLSYERETK